MSTDDPAHAAEIYAVIAADYGRAHIATASDFERWVELAEQVVDSASPLEAPLFAGWRAIQRP